MTNWQAAPPKMWSGTSRLTNSWAYHSQPFAGPTLQGSPLMSSLFDHHCHLEFVAAMLTESYTGKIEGTWLRAWRNAGRCGQEWAVRNGRCYPCNSMSWTLCASQSQFWFGRLAVEDGLYQSLIWTKCKAILPAAQVFGGAVKKSKYTTLYNQAKDLSCVSG